MIDGDDEDSFEMEAHLEEQAKTTPLSSKPEPDSKPQAQTGQEQGKAAEQPANEAEPALPDDLKGKFVPHGRFHELNERFKSSQQKYASLEQRTEKLLDIVNRTLAQPQQAEQPKPVEIPGPEDFIGRQEYSLKELASIKEMLQGQQAQSKAQAEGIELGKRVYNATRQDFAEAAAEDPALQEAYDFLAASRGRELMVARNLSKPEAEAAFQQEELELYHQALQRGERPSAVVKRLAEARGWAPKPAGQQQEQQPNREQRREQHQSLTQMSGGTAPKPLTAKDLANMDEDAFAQLSEKTIQSIMRGKAA